MQQLMPDRLRGLKIQKKITYTTEGAKTVLENEKNIPGNVMFHLVTNDVKTKGPEKCIQKMRDLVWQVKDRRPDVKVFMSLPPPVKDNQLNKKVNAVNSLLKVDFDCIDHLYSSIDRGYMIRELYTGDGIHLTKKGTARLAWNIKNYFQNRNMS